MYYLDGATYEKGCTDREKEREKVIENLNGFQLYVVHMYIGSCNVYNRTKYRFMGL